MTGNENWAEILWLAARGDPTAVKQLKEFAEGDPKRCSQQLRKFVSSDNHADEIGTCDLLNALAEIEGVDSVDNWIREEWRGFRPAARRKICAWVFLADGMSTELALSLFEHESSLVRDRHLIAAGLAASAQGRSAESLVVRLLDRIGEYDDANRQRSLSAFIHSARSSFKKA